MLLAIDIGNTHIVIGIFDNEKLLGSWRLSSSISRTEDESYLVIKLLLDQINASPGKISGVVISSVVPNFTNIYKMLAVKYFKKEPIIVSANLKLGIKVLYQTPSAVGADRLCNAVAAYNKYGGPCVIIDFGTATTFDIVSKKGEYLGGIIYPGIETASVELHRRAAQLPKIELKFPENIIGRNTIESMQAGIMYGALDAMEGLIKRIEKELGHKVTVIATGGYSKSICQKSKLKIICAPDLVLEGAMIIYKMNI